jgi:hypothetical protein
MATLGFLHKYYDWDAFETFVEALHAADGDTVVEHNVIELDRYGAKRQTDVKITRRTRFYTYVTLVECKRWKEPVSRDRIDVLASSIEALGANKGAIFTTTGFEEGAVAYATGKGIDLFIVRDLLPQEWGLPGREILFYLHTWAGEFRGLAMPNAKAIPLIDDNPASINLDIRLDKEMAKDPNLDLFSVKTGKPGPNIVGILADAHRMILDGLSKGFGLIEGGKTLTLHVRSACEIDLSGTEYRQLRLPNAAVRLERIKTEFLASVSQVEFKFDRGANLDFALVVEDYITNQRHLAHRRANDPGINFSVANPPDADPQKVLQNGSLLNVLTLPWVGVGNVVPDKTAIVAQLIRISVGVADGKLQLALQSEPLPASPSENAAQPI